MALNSSRDLARSNVWYWENQLKMVIEKSTELEKRMTLNDRAKMINEINSVGNNRYRNYDDVVLCDFYRTIVEWRKIVVLELVKAYQDLGTIY